MRSRIVLGVLVVLAVGVIAGGYTIWQAAKPASIPSFYDAIGPPGAAGQVTLTEAIKDAPAGTRLWRMLYGSKSEEGRPVTISALVAAPAGPEPAGGYPLVAVGHGTAGINQACAPSIDPLAKVNKTQTSYDFLMSAYVKAGYVVVMTDYMGLGVKGANSYLVGAAEGRNILDSARAVQNFSDFRLRDGVLLAGQSQGGHAALFAAQMAAEYAPELKIQGVAAQAPATDLGQLFSGIVTANKRGGVVSLPLMAADAYTHYYPVKIDQLLTKRGEKSLKNVIKPLCLIPAVLATSLATPSDLMQPKALDALGPYVAKNTPGTKFNVPMFVAQGDADTVVPPAITAEYAAKLCKSRDDLEFHKYPGTGHFEVVDASNPDLIKWMAAVRAGNVPQSTCPG